MCRRSSCPVDFPPRRNPVGEIQVQRTLSSRGRWTGVARSERSAGLSAPSNGGQANVKTGAMKNKLFVGGLSWDTTDEGLREAFEQFGEVDEAKVITDRDTGRSRGFGFVTYSQAENAETAMESMNGATLDGRQINVNEARERQPRGGGGGGGGRGPRRSF